MSTSRLGAWLGLFALLMLFAGPLATQLQAAGYQAQLAAVQAELSCHTADLPAKQSVPQLDCGYCQLVSHFSGLPVAFHGYGLFSSDASQPTFLVLPGLAQTLSLPPPSRAPPGSPLS